jgi:LysM repeat protein
MTIGGSTADAAHRCARFAASVAIVALAAACAIDVTEYTPFATGSGTTRVAHDREADPITTASITTASIPPSRPARAAKADRAVASTVVVAHGDTLYAIARRHRTSVDRIAEANAIPRPYIIKPGQRLAVPGAAPAIVPAAAPVHSGAIRQTVQVPIKGGVVVGRGDTLYSIARRNRVDMADLMAANAIADPARIRPGQVLMLPYQRTAALAVSEHTGSIPRAAARPPAEDRRSGANAAYSKVMSDFRVVPGQSILAPF